MPERLNKLLSRWGVASRRKAESMILEGRVSVNGRIVNSVGIKVEETDEIMIDGRPVKKSLNKRYLMLYKPPGYVTTLRDPKNRPTIIDLVKVPERVYPVGRLDFDSEGLLLLTNDGDFAFRIQHPRFGISKTYLVLARGKMGEVDIIKLKEGIPFSDGLFRPVEVHVDGYKGLNTWLKLTIKEGRNRIIRRALGHLGYPVLRLIRIAVDGLHIGTLRSGQFRELTQEEIRRIFSLIEKTP